MDPEDFEKFYNEIKQYPFTENQSLKLKIYFDNLYDSTYDLNRKFSDSEKENLQYALEIGPHADRRSSYHSAARPLDYVDIQNDSNSNSNGNSSKHTKKRKLSNSNHTKKRKRSKGGNTAKKTKK
jgi:hypothetical protein